MSFRRNSLQFRMGRKTGANGSHAAAADSVALITDTWISSPFLLLPPSLPPPPPTGNPTPVVFIPNNQSINLHTHLFLSINFFFILGGGEGDLFI